MKRRQRTAEDFWQYVEPEPNTGCWLWDGKTVKDGYGLFCLPGSTGYAHNASMVIHGRTVPKGLQVDHLCRVRCCVNPDHLDIVTRKENVLRGEGITARNARKTHCYRGHPFSGDNLRHYGTDRCCRTCEAIKRKAYYDRHPGRASALRKAWRAQRRAEGKAKSRARMIVSPTMVAVLANLRDGRDAGAHLSHVAADRASLSRTLKALRRWALVDSEDGIAEAGRAVLAAWD